MRGRAVPQLAFLGALVLLASFATPPAGAARQAAAALPAGLDKINHIIVVVQENRSFDQYFGTYPGADGIPMRHGHPTVCIPDPVLGHCVRPYHDRTLINGGGPHDLPASKIDVNHGHMNGFNRAVTVCTRTRSAPSCAYREGPGHVLDVMGYHTAREIPNYWAYAHHFVLQDHMYAPEESWTLPSHLYLVSGWSASCANARDPMSCHSNLKMHSLADAPHRAAQRTWAWTDITYLLHQAGVSWAYYVDPHTCLAEPCGGHGTEFTRSPLPDFTDVHTDGQLGNIQHHSAYFQAAASGTLPSVSWVMPPHGRGDHPPDSIRAGEAWVTQVVNAAMTGPDWNSTALFLTWDDWGGFYDHAPPIKIDQNGYGIRVPGLLISPWARSGYVDHQTLSFDAYLKLIEDRFLGGQRLNPATDGRPDSRPTVRESVPKLGNLANEFDFNQTPLPPFILKPNPKPRLAQHEPVSPRLRRYDRVP